MERLTDYLRLANQEAKTARAGGNTPFGAILVDDVTGEVLMRQGNAEGDTHDATAHAEFVLASRASRTYSKEKLWKCTVYRRHLLGQYRPHRLRHQRSAPSRADGSRRQEPDLLHGSR